MTVKKIWMPPTAGRKNRYAVTTLGSILGIALLMLLLIAGGITLSFALSLPREITAVVLCLGVTLLGVGLALCAGRRSVQEATVFFLTQDDKLYVLDARQFPYQDYRAAGYVANAAKTQQFLQNLAEKPFLPAAASEIRKVESMRENRTHYALRCQVCRPHRPVMCHTYLLVKGYEDETALRHELMRRESWETALEPKENRNPFFLFLSGLFFCFFVAGCLLSHPAFQQWPQALYYPFLLAAFVAFFFIIYFLIRQRRGE